MKSIKFFAMAAIAALALSSCSKEINSNNPADGKSKVVVLKVVQATGETRAEADATGAATIALGTGHVFFTDANGVITRKVAIVTTTPGDDEVSLTSISNTSTGATILNVPSNTTKCYILSKAASVDVSGVVVGDNISELTAKTVALADMTDATNNTVVNVPLFGEGEVTVESETLLKTTVPVGALGARLQLTSFKGGGDIKSYKIEGIFVNNFFATMPLSKTLAAANAVDYASDYQQYVAGYNGYTSLVDYDADGLGQAGNTSLDRVPVNTPDYDNPVWAYNIFPTEGVPTGDQADVFPMIVVKLKDVVWNNNGSEETLPNPQFVTVKGMKQGGNPLTKIEARHVYTYSTIAFERKAVTDIPDVSSIDAEVKVELLEWIPEAVEPEM